MYKVFIENTPVKIQKESPTFDKFKEFLPELKKNQYGDFVKVIKNNPEELLTLSDLDGLNFFSQLKFVEAAGGIVYHTKLNKYLFIHRLGKWDLPKGKLDQEENPEKAAAREIREECGISGIQLIKPLTATYHTYQLHNDTWYKKTYWYYFEYDKYELLAPQTNEGITIARWFSKEEFDRILANTYGNIADVVGFI
jgi:8-oxo-dGTP pyrophosphatase MutT (NUDIX family)